MYILIHIYIYINTILINPFSIRPSVWRADHFEQKPDDLGGTIVVTAVH